MKLNWALVRKERLELSRLAALEPKSSASTNSATFALLRFQLCRADYNTKSSFYPHHRAPAQPALQHLREHLRQLGERHGVRHLRQQPRTQVGCQAPPDFT